MDPRTITPPEDALWILNRLNKAGYPAYVVGGCVRDSLLGIEPNDWDICTGASPQDLQRLFRDCHLVETGLKHGTVTVVLHHTPYEVTTFRVDGDYTDHRHPDEVRFVRDVREDLLRRDFTVNAMAWNPWEGLIDCSDGRTDLEKGIIRCVGDPKARFQEDALRVLRAIRFASVFGFTVDPDTAYWLREIAKDLRWVAQERVRVELEKLLCGKGAAGILRDYSDVIACVLPEIAPSIGFDQRTPYHRWDVWEHTLRTVDAAPRDRILRWTMLFHDLGKPACFTVDGNGTGHAYGHAKESGKLAAAALERLHMDRASIDRILLLVEAHDWKVQTDRPALLRLLNRIGAEAAEQLISVQRADEIGKGIRPVPEIEEHTLLLQTALRDLLADKPCYTFRDLCVNGNDLRQAGVQPGPAMGELLRQMLEAVMDGAVPNEREALYRYFHLQD